MRISLVVLLTLAGAASAQTAVPGAAAGCGGVDYSSSPVGAVSNWSGTCKDGFPDGAGALQWTLNGKETDRYEGYVVKGVPNGKGAYQFVNGTIHQGTFKDGKLDGQGVIARPDGTKLIARFEQGRPVGSVKLLEPSGDRYEGEWNSGAEGVGTKTFALGGSYRGHWHKGAPYGEGEIVYTNGQVLKGQFAGNFRLDGQGAPESGGPTYTVKQTDASIGSHLRKDSGSNFEVPPEKNYEALTPNQKLLVKQPYSILQAEDVPPYPRGGKAEVMRGLSLLAGEMQQRGTIRATVWIDDKGVPQNVSVLIAPTTDLGEQVAKALMLSKYKPGRCAGQPCAMAVPFFFEFTMED